MRPVVVAAAVLMCAIVAVAARAPDQLPQSFINLQIFPKDVSRAALVDAMKTFTGSLGVRCEHCHVGEGNDLSKFDFASDAKATKVTTRAMMRMLTTINRDSLKGIGDAGRQPKVTCFTCHRGAKTPATVRPAAGGPVPSLAVR